MPQCEIGHIVIFRRGGEAIERGKRIPPRFSCSGKPPLHRLIPTDTPEPGKVLLRVFDGPVAAFG